MSMVEQIPVETYLHRKNIDFKVVPHAETYTTLTEARAVGIPSEEVLKAVLLRLSDGYAVAVVPGSRRLDLRLIREVTTDHHASLASEDEIAVAFPDFVLGALPPIPGVLGVRGFVDPTVFDHDLVAFAAGIATESVVANPRTLFWGEDVLVYPISKEPEDEKYWRLEW